MLDDRQGSRVGGGEAAGGGGSPRIALPFEGDVIQPPQVATRKASDGQDEWEGGPTECEQGCKTCRISGN